MKTIHQLVTTSFTLLAAVVAFAAQPLPGPKGGKIVTAEAPHVEFFVGNDRTVTVSFYDQALQPVTPSGQLVTVVVETKTGKVNLTFSTKDGALVSSAPLPEGDGLRIVVQVRDSAQAKPRNYRLEFHDEVCGGCQRAEYACICEEHGEAEHGHKH